MFFLFLTIFSFSILPDKEKRKKSLHVPQIIPNPIQDKLSNFISSFTIKLIPQKYHKFIKGHQETEKNQEIEKSIEKGIREVPLIANKNTDFVFYTTFSILIMAIMITVYIFIRQITKKDKKTV